MELKKITLKELYTKVVEKTAKLDVCGWEGLPLDYVSVTHGCELSFFIKEWENIKQGVDNLLVAIAISETSSNNYTINNDTLHISSEKSKFGVLVELKTTMHYFHGVGSLSGNCSTETKTHIENYLIVS